jgi:hypothetical protein
VAEAAEAAARDNDVLMAFIQSVTDKVCHSDAPLQSQAQPVTESPCPTLACPTGARCRGAPRQRLRRRLREDGRRRPRIVLLLLVLVVLLVVDVGVSRGGGGVRGRHASAAVRGERRAVGLPLQDGAGQDQHGRQRQGAHKAPRPGAVTNRARGRGRGRRAMYSPYAPAFLPSPCVQ